MVNQAEERKSSRLPRSLMRALAYLRKPEVWVGGILVFVVTQGVDAFKTYRADTRSDVAAARDAIWPEVKDLPATSAGLRQTIVKVQGLYALHDSLPARELIGRTIGGLSDQLARQKAVEDAKEAEEAAKLAEADAKSRADAAAAEAARLVAQRKAQEEAALREEAKRAARAFMEQRAFDRAPK